MMLNIEVVDRVQLLSGVASKPEKVRTLQSIDLDNVDFR